MADSGWPIPDGGRAGACGYPVPCAKHNTGMRSTRRRPREAELDDEIRPATRVRFYANLLGLGPSEPVAGLPRLRLPQRAHARSLGGEDGGLEFGRMFLALDPDGHRLRVLRPAVA